MSTQSAGTVVGMRSYHSVLNPQPPMSKRGSNVLLNSTTDLRGSTGMFACASRIKMPQFGDDERSIDVKTSRRDRERTVPGERSSEVLTKKSSSTLFESSSAPVVSNTYLKKISADLTFAEDVVEDRCMHMTNYSDKYFHRAIDATDIIKTRSKVKYSLTRCNTRGTDTRHPPCNLRKRIPYKLKPLKRKILDLGNEMHQRTLQKEAECAAKRKEEEEMTEDGSFFLTQPHMRRRASSPLRSSPTAQPAEPQKDEWDKYLMSLISDTTAQWIVAKKTDPGPLQDSLLEFLGSRLGKMSEVNDQIIPDDASEPEDNGQHTERKPWKRSDETLLDRVRAEVAETGLPTDPYGDENLAAFYRLPAGQKRAKKHFEKEQEAVLEQRETRGAINGTAHRIEVTSYEPPPIPSLKDQMHSGLKNTIMTTRNAFTEEWLTGHAQIHQKLADPSLIVMDSNNRYKKQLQDPSPQDPNKWFKNKDSQDEEGEKKASVGMLQRGLRRWKTLPEPVDLSASTMKTPWRIEQEQAEQQLRDVEARKKERAESRDASRRRARNNNTLVTIAEDWRSKWHLDMRYADASPEDLIRDMADLHVHIRLKAITTCARAAEYKPPPQPGIQLDTSVNKNDHAKLLPPELFIALECCLEDAHDQVAGAAAIALYTLEKPSAKAEALLRKTLTDHKSVDRWTAAQCLAYYGECDSDVVGELISQFMTTQDPIRTEQAGFLLARLSETSTLVHSMIAEQLNNDSWRARILACKLIPKLHGHINKDLAHKLSYLMWHDWHSAVRQVAAQTLGRTGHGKEVHDDLVKVLHSGNEKERQEAVIKVGNLGIMTARLLPVFLECFSDPYVSVRREVCIASTNLGIKDMRVVNRLVYLATYDPIWRVKALAIQAIGVIGVVDTGVRECIVWAFRYEEQEGVRAEACHTIVVLKIMDGDVVQILQDRYLVETSSIVKDEIRSALERLDISPAEDMDMVAQVKGEVRKLCTKQNVAAQIASNEKVDELCANIERMIYIDPETKAEMEREPRYKPVRRRHAISHASERPSSGSSRASMSRESRYTPGADREIMDIMGGVPHSAGSDEGSINTSDHDILSEISSRPKSLSHMAALLEEEDEEDSIYMFVKPEDHFQDTRAYVEVLGKSEDDLSNKGKGKGKGEGDNKEPAKTEVVSPRRSAKEKKIKEEMRLKIAALKEEKASSPLPKKWPVPRTIKRANTSERSTKSNESLNDDSDDVQTTWDSNIGTQTNTVEGSVDTALKKDTVADADTAVKKDTAVDVVSEANVEVEKDTAVTEDTTVEKDTALKEDTVEKDIALKEDTVEKDIAVTDDTAVVDNTNVEEASAVENDGKEVTEEEHK